MRFVTYLSAGAERVGLVIGDEVHALPAGTRLLDLLGDDGEMLFNAGEQAKADPAEVVPLVGVRLLPPVPQPPSVRDFITFEQHVDGVGRLAGKTEIPPVWYEQPLFYFSNPHSIIGPHDDVPIPPGCTDFDFELEVAAVVGTTGRDLTPDQAERHIAGYTILNDWSARDLQWREMTFGLGPAKGKDSATTLGPMLVTPDELAPYRSGTSFDIGMRVSVNGTLVGEDRLHNMHWSFGEMIAHASRGTSVRPGDIIGSGTCGNGCLAELRGRGKPVPPLQPGDVVEMAVDQLGATSNVVVGG